MTDFIPARHQPALPRERLILHDGRDGTEGVAERLEMDVLFVGAGPAGLAGAIELANLVRRDNEAGGGLGDLNIAEPGALIGFAGPRVIEQTIRQKLPEGFQRSEFLVEHGMVDMVVDRRELKPVLVRALRFFLA